MNKTYLTNEETLQNYGAMFENLAKNLDLKTELAEYGYDEAKIAEGKALYDVARKTFDANQKEVREEAVASLVFREKYEQTHQIYMVHRKKVRIIFDENQEALQKLSFKSRVSRVYATSIEEMKAFYQILDTTEEFRQPLEQLKVSGQDIKNQLTEIAGVEKLYASYIQEKGESQQATKDKNTAFDNIDKWVSRFYKVAKIALEDKPQLLESLGKFVKS